MPLCVNGSPALNIVLTVNVCTPDIDMSSEIIDFGKVSYKFPVNKTVYLTNTSEVDINYSIRVPGDGRALH
jgi:hypothetical protein